MPLPTAYEDSDADDEYERSVVSAPLVTDSETSPTDSDPPSTENTPTFYGNIGDDKSPRTIITEWTTEECAEYVSSLGLSQYADAFLENEIVGEALVALNHDELKEMGIASVGHRLTLLKSVYDIKVKQDIPIDTDHYIPLSADSGMQDAVATQADIARIIQSMKMRDQRLLHAEQELRKVSEEYRKLREELLPIFRMAKDKSQPLPWPSAAAGVANDGHGHEQLGMNPIGQLPPGKSTGISRKRSDKKLVLGTVSNNASPTHIPPSILENKPYISENVNVDPSAAVLAATTHLSASATGGAGGAGGAGGGGGSQPSASPIPPNIPSPTSPPFYKDSGAPSPVIPRSGPQLSTASLASSNRPPPPPYASHDELRLLPTGTYSHPPTSHPDSRSNVMPTPLVPRRHEASGGPTNVAAPPVAPAVSSLTGDGMSTPPANNTTPFKSFKVSMEDPCHKVLPAALKKYNISANWKEYALYIVYGDEERCLELDEKPLILFKQLDREGRKPMFMLRKISPPPADAHLTGVGGGGNGGGGGGGAGGGVAGNLAAGSLGGGGGAGQSGIGSQGGGVHHSGNVRGAAYQSGVTLPGGVL